VITRHHHTTLFVNELDRSIDFYCGTLGGKLLNREDERGGEFLDVVCNHPDTRLGLALVELGGVVFELIVPLSPPDHRNDANAMDHGIARVGFEVEDIEGTVADLKAKGVRFMSDVQTVSETAKHFAGGKAVFFRDPDGIILELQEPHVKGQIT
jgi:catechol 2,3-dioxygenase-like lactoylglutathione lyase family enzyme